MRAGVFVYRFLQRGSESVSLFHLFHLFIDWSGNFVSLGVGVVVGGCVFVVLSGLLCLTFPAFHLDRGV